MPTWHPWAFFFNWRLCEWGVAIVEKSTFLHNFVNIHWKSSSDISITMFSGSENMMESFKIAKNMKPCICMQINSLVSKENRRSRLFQTWLCTALFLRTIGIHLHFAFTVRVWPKRIVRKTTRKKFYFNIINHFLLGLANDIQCILRHSYLVIIDQTSFACWHCMIFTIILSTDCLVQNYYERNWVY